MPGLGSCSQTEAHLHSQDARGFVEARIEAAENERLLNDHHRVMSGGELHGVIRTQGECVRKLAGLFHQGLGDLQDQQPGPVSREGALRILDSSAGAARARREKAAYASAQAIRQTATTSDAATSPLTAALSASTTYSFTRAEVSQNRITVDPPAPAR